MKQGLQLIGLVDFRKEEHKEHSKIKEILNQSQLIEQLVAMIEKYQNMVKTCFQGNTIFDRARSNAFEAFLNEDETNSERLSMGEVLAVYTDNIFRKGGMKAVQERGTEEEYLKQIIALFTHLVDKDLFIEVYRSYLAKRLLNEKSQSLDLERSMISYIKMSCGPQFTKRLEGMMNDLALAQEESKAYEQHVVTSGKGQIDF